MKSRFTTILTAVAMMTVVNANAADWFFSPNGAGEGSGDSWENAASAEDLAGALADPETIAPGDNVYLLAGTYKHQAILWTITPGVNIYGGYPATMKGTDTAITYPVAENSIFTADYDGDGNGDNGESCFITITFDGKKEDAPKNVLAGLTIRDAKCTSTGSYKGAALVVFSGNVELSHCKIINNVNGYVDADGTTLKGAGAVTSVCGAYLYAHDCVWADNKATRAGSAIIIRGAAGKSGTAANELAGTNPEKSVVYLDRCELSNNVLLDPANAKATYGGTIAVGDYCGNLYMNNCTATGTEISWAGAFCRLGGGDSMWMTNSTLYGFKCNYSSRYSGTILSCGTGSKLYAANNVAVIKEDGKDGMFATMFHQGGDGGVLETGGWNIWGSLNDASGATFATTDNIANTNTHNVVLGNDNPTLAAQGGNGTKVVTVKEDYRGMTVTELKALATKWSLPEQINVALDQRGLARPETTIAGAYDPKATSATGLENNFAVKAETLKVTALGNGNFAVNTQGVVQVYDLSGKLVQTSTNGVVNLSNAAKGVYVVRVNSQAQKIVK